VVVAVKTDGSIAFNQQTISGEELVAKLRELAKLYPDQAVILWGDQNAPYKFIANVLDLCRQANIWNVAFATGTPGGT
jgi:biopolymer transport protein ExbD